MSILLRLCLETYFKNKSWQGWISCLCDSCPGFTWSRQLSENLNIWYDTEDEVRLYGWVVTISWSTVELPHEKLWIDNAWWHQQSPFLRNLPHKTYMTDVLKRTQCSSRELCQNHYTHTVSLSLAFYSTPNSWGSLDVCETSKEPERRDGEDQNFETEHRRKRWERRKERAIKMEIKCRGRRKRQTWGKRGRRWFGEVRGNAETY